MEVAVKQVDSFIEVNLLKTSLSCMPKCQRFKYAVGISCKRTVSTVDFLENKSRSIVVSRYSL